MAKVKLADVLWDAANKYLSATFLPVGILGDKYEYSCHAFNRARFGHRHSLDAKTDFLESLGLHFYYNDCDAWRDFLEGRELQGVRYMWLLLAMHVAEDEDIEIEATND